MLSLVRILMVPLLVALYYADIRHRGVTCCAVFTVAAITDWLDGYLARRWKISSAFGAFLDPVADKLMVATTLVILSSGHHGRVFDVALPASITISREIAVSALREWMAQIGARESVKVGWMGKCKAFAQMVALSGLLLSLPSPEASKVPFSNFLYASSLALLWASTLMALSSAYDYFKAALPVLTKIG
eukprot:CAMPEP_0173419272 /NCGR_PEP_ID=MMETSP1357-20121228/1185_1 /TAXON_ID=77926 /ORGANISM="Hemiselmis rufescens, Strain PCC563" /LENGTH=188 /DNA_ID=CAMNT_0014381895 /DNA_START=144 /DNA_END=710 /DNA_ORIENTATION=+